MPTVLISPLIAPGTVYRVPAGSTPLDHTSILATVEQRWGLHPLTARDAAAPAFGSVLTLAAPRTDDVLAGVTVPVAGSAGPSAGQVSHLEAIRQQLPANTAPADAPSAPAILPALARISAAGLKIRPGRPVCRRAEGTQGPPVRDPKSFDAERTARASQPCQFAPTPRRPRADACASAGCFMLICVSSH